MVRRSAYIAYILLVFTDHMVHFYTACCVTPVIAIDYTCEQKKKKTDCEQLDWELPQSIAKVN